MDEVPYSACKEMGHMLCFDAQNSQSLPETDGSRAKRDLLLLLFHILEVAKLGEFKGWHCSLFILPEKSDLHEGSDLSNDAQPFKVHVKTQDPSL